MRITASAICGNICGKCEEKLFIYAKRQKGQAHSCVMNEPLNQRLRTCRKMLRQMTNIVAGAERLGWDEIVNATLRCKTALSRKMNAEREAAHRSRRKRHR